MKRSAFAFGLLASTALVAVGALVPVPVFAATGETEVGVTTVVNTQATGTPPVSPARDLDTGVEVFFNERVETDAGGRTQLLFRDGTSITIGPNSDMVIDRYVYDPETGVGDMAVSVTKGFFRLVGGRISKRKPIEFKTPVATVGVLGGIAVIEQQPGGRLEADFLFGEQMTVTSNQVSVSTERPGRFISVPTASQAPQSSEKRGQTEIKQKLAAFERSSTTRSPGDASSSGEGSQNQQNRNQQTGNQQTGNQQSGNQQSGNQQSGNQQSGNQRTGNQQTGPQPVRADQTRIEQLTTNAVGGVNSTEPPPRIDTQPLATVATTTTSDNGTRDGDRQTTLTDNNTFRQINDDTAINSVRPPPPPPTSPPPETTTTTRPVSPPPTTAPPPPPPPTVTSPPPTVVSPPPVVASPPPPPPPPTPLSITFTGGMAFSSTSAPTGTGADRNTSTAQLSARRFTSASVSGSDQTVGGRFSGSTGAGSYSFFYPGTNNSSPTALNECPSALDCTLTYPNQPSTTDTANSKITHPTNDFVVIDLIGNDASKEFIVVGTEFTGTAPSTGLYNYNLAADIFIGSDIPFARQTDTGFTNGSATTELEIYFGSTGTPPALGTKVKVDQTNGRSTASVLIGSFNTSGKYITGVAYAAVDPSGTGTPSLFKGPLATADTNSGADFFGTSGPNNFVLNSVADADGGAGAGMNLAGGGGTPYYPVSVGTLGSTGSPGTRSFTGLTGFVGGAGKESGTDTYFRTNNPGVGGSSIVTISPTADTVSVDLSVQDASTDIYRYQTSTGTSAHIDNENFASQLEGGEKNSTPTTTTGYLVATEEFTVDGTTFDLCSSCQFLTWGVWGGEVNPGTTPDLAVHMAGWVAGNKATTAVLAAAATKSATYTGNVIGTVLDTNGTAVKTGTFSSAVTFGATTYDVTSFSLTFNGDTFNAGTATGTANASNFAITDTSSVGGKTMFAQGYLFGTPGVTNDPPPEMAGDFAISGTGYNAGGVFAGRK